MKILTIGDSHAVYPWHHIKVEGVEISCAGHVPNALMYHFGKEKWIIETGSGCQCHSPMTGKRGDGVLYCRKCGKDWPGEHWDVAIFFFGEIDCRMKIHKYRNIQEIVDNYMDAISVNRFPKICVSCVPPPVRVRDFPLHMGQPLGSDEERKQYVLEMNRCLKAGCDWNGYIFMDVYVHYCDVEGFMDASKSEDGTHFGDVKPLIKFIEWLKGRRSLWEHKAYTE
jgi:hypothetical protein